MALFSWIFLQILAQFTITIAAGKVLFRVHHINVNTSNHLKFIEYTGCENLPSAENVQVAIFQSNVKISSVTGDRFAMIFSCSKRDETHGYFCLHEGKTREASVESRRGTFKDYKIYCKKPSSSEIEGDTTYWLFANETNKSINLTMQLSHQTKYFKFNSSLLKDTWWTFQLKEIQKVEYINPLNIILPIYVGELLVVALFLVIWKYYTRLPCWKSNKSPNFFDIKRAEIPIDDRVFPDPIYRTSISSAHSTLTEHKSNSSEEHSNGRCEELSSNETISKPPRYPIPVLPIPQDFLSKFMKTKHISRSSVGNEHPPKQIHVNPVQQVKIPNFLQELKDKQQKRKGISVLHTKIKPNLERDSQIVSTELEHIEVLDKKCNRSTYMDMSGLQKLKRPKPGQLKEEGIYENMTGLRRTAQAIGRMEAKMEHLSSRVIATEEPFFYEIGSTECESILGNIKDRDPNRTVIWSMHTRNSKYKYETKVELTEKINFRTGKKSHRRSKQGLQQMEPQRISVFFDDASNTDSIGTCSDIDRLSYISALDGIYRSSSQTNQSKSGNVHYAYLLDNMQNDNFKSEKSTDFSNRCYKESLEGLTEEDPDHYHSKESVDSGLSEDDSKDPTCLVCKYKKDIIYVNLSEVKEDQTDRVEGRKFFPRKGSTKSLNKRNDQIRVRVVNNDRESRRSTMFLE